MSHVRHPIEEESFRIIESFRDWSAYSLAEKEILKRLVHTTGDPTVVDNITISDGAIAAARFAFSQKATVITDVTMVQYGLNRINRERIGYDTFCGVHDKDAYSLAQSEGITRSSAAILSARKKFGDNVIVAVGNAPTALIDTVQAILQGWRPHLVIGFPVGFVNIIQSKQALLGQSLVPYIGNDGYRGGSPWAATTINALMTVFLEGYDA
ncbi:MAG: precorrin-8X methylmutase [Opitutales bacterium]|nr:precorrin-8X methylmutase [Opitutales bacterium]